MHNFVVFVGGASTRNKNSVVAALHVAHNLGYGSFHLPANTISLYCVPEFFAYRKSEFCLLNVAFAKKQHEVVVRNALGMFVDVVVLVVLFKSVNRLQAMPLLSGNLFATLVSASLESSSAAGGLHSCSKTVHFASLSFLGLVSSFHDMSPYLARNACFNAT